MSGLGEHPGYINRPQRNWLVFSVVLALGLGTYAWIHHVLAKLPTAALLTVSALVLVLIAIPFVLIRRLQLARTQRDRALAQVDVIEWQMCEGLKKQAPCMALCAARRIQTLQNETTSLRARDQLLQFQAHHDSLTGLANRNLLTDRFYSAVERSKRSGKMFALLMVDLNDFKTVNDNYGHAVGDAVLITMARRLVGALRAADTVARLGGDEFVLIIESIEDAQEIACISEKLFDTLSEPITLDTGVVVNTGASVGLALYPDHGADMNDLLNVADQAMYECKSSGLMGLH